jgi:hypothetical protein
MGMTLGRLSLAALEGDQGEAASLTCFSRFMKKLAVLFS